MQNLSGGYELYKFGSGAWPDPVSLTSFDVEYVDIDTEGNALLVAIINIGSYCYVQKHSYIDGSLQWQQFINNSWTNSITTDQDDNVYVLSGLPVQVRKISSTGDSLWSASFGENSLGYGDMCSDEEGNLYLSIYASPNHLVAKINSSGIIRWTELLPPVDGYLFRQHSYIDIDDSNYVYAAIATYRQDDFPWATRILKLKGEKQVTIRDGRGDSIPDVEFELYKVANDPPIFSETLLGKFTTDGRGRVEMTPIAADSFRIELDPKPDTIAVGDSLRIVKHVYDKPAARRPGSMYSIWLDNATFASDGHVYFDSLTAETHQDIFLDHTELRYNLRVDVMWVPSEAYQMSLMENLMNFSNYLYDVSDGQIRLDTVIVKVEGWGSAMGDLKIMANNVEWPHCDNGVGGIYQLSHQQQRQMVMPRKWYGDSTSARYLSFSEAEFTSGVLDVNTSTDYRTKVHEFGHYGLGFYDEYLFWLPTMFGLSGGYTPDTGLGLRCLPRNIFNYGFMDYQYDTGGPTANASEMSSAYRYEMNECRNTQQYREFGMSCWDYLEAMIEPFVWRGPDGIYVPILKPDADDPDERDSLSVNNIFVGPNDDINNLDYDVGSKIVFASGIHAAPPGYDNKKITVSHPDGVDRVLVYLNNKLSEPIPPPKLYQGMTSDAGKIWVLGAYEPDCLIEVSKNSQAGRWSPKAMSLSSGAWLYGSLTSITGDSALIAMNEVSGDYPLVVRAGLTAGGVDISLDAPNLLPEIPTLELQPIDTSVFQYSMTTTSQGYIVDITDAYGTTGMLTVGAVDNVAAPFAFTCPYTAGPLAPDSLSPLWTISSSDGRGEVVIDTANAALETGFMLNSPYPVPLAGLGIDALQVGDVFTLALYPDMELTGVNQLFIRYQNDDFRINDIIAGDESSLAIFRWDTTGQQWMALSSAVDTVENIVTAAVSGSGTYAAFTTSIISDIDDDEHGEILPYKFELSQNYPNPFNPVTTIEYSLQERSQVTIEIYNVLGQKVETLVDENQSAGSYTVIWDGSDTSGKSVATGIYLYRFQAGDYVQTKKMLLLK